MQKSVDGDVSQANSPAMELASDTGGASGSKQHDYVHAHDSPPQSAHAAHGAAARADEDDGLGAWALGAQQGVLVKGRGELRAAAAR